ncbi:DUF2017 domain-containing protein [Streptomyces sp. SL13]|uniref:DUF2017 domain-containing protein n=1 Tax=Streptantibioticus silvisoli TaxID=2705255 RepID=A0AA90H5X7_9ACTN|nr:DUF2017 domain-containing protein [Streptantibioticus silvisoli]MDI5967726.1 DUF2017 domain-containing protein [Streptantibioticus silvisoli]MDI5972516.1 DUF2017 domain-containing protein [Streptantibioticus silvisoli]
MAGYFKAASDGAAVVTLDEVDTSILRTLTVQLLELIGPGPQGADADAPDADPLAALFTDGPTTPPDDPALARLFPNAYHDPERAADDKADEASAEFRRYTENDLRAGKRADALSVVHDLDHLTPRRNGSARLTLSREQVPRWLRTLNDLRLTIGTVLDVDDDPDSALYHLDDDDPRKPYVIAYMWLGALQETLVETQLR